MAGYVDMDDDNEDIPLADELTASVEIYDCETDMWRTAAPMQLGQGSHE